MMLAKTPTMPNTKVTNKHRRTSVPSGTPTMVSTENTVPPKILAVPSNSEVVRRAIGVSTGWRCDIEL